MRRYRKWAGNPEGHAEDEMCCVAEVHGQGRSPLGHQCYRKRGHGILGLFCKQHAAKPASTYVPKGE